MHDRGDEAADPAQQQRPDALPEQVVEGRRHRDAVPLADVADQQHLPEAVEARASRTPRAGARHHGATTTRNRATQPTAARERDRGRPGRRPPDRQRAPAVPQRTRGRRSPPARARRRCGRAWRAPTSRPASANVARSPRRPRAASHSAPATSGWKSAKLSGWAMNTSDSGRDGGQDAGADRDGRRRAGVPGDRPGRAARRAAPMQRERQRGRDRGRAEEPDERHLDERRERHPVRVRRDRQDRVGRDRAADLGEDPDEVDVEAVPGGERPRDVDVVEGIGVGGVGKQADDGRARTTRASSVQEHGDAHGRCSLAPDPGHSRGYESATRTPLPSRRARARTRRMVPGC